MIIMGRHLDHIYNLLLTISYTFSLLHFQLSLSAFISDFQIISNFTFSFLFRSCFLFSSLEIFEIWKAKSEIWIWILHGEILKQIFPEIVFSQMNSSGFKFWKRNIGTNKSLANEFLRIQILREIFWEIIFSQMKSSEFKFWKKYSHK